jgi:hypothetical protein
VGSNTAGGIDVCLLWVLSGRCLCDGPIPRPEESYRLWCITVCDLETSRMRRPWSALGCCAGGKGGGAGEFTDRICFPESYISVRTWHSAVACLSWRASATLVTDLDVILNSWLQFRLQSEHSVWRPKCKWLVASTSGLRIIGLYTAHLKMCW